MAIVIAGVRRDVRLRECAEQFEAQQASGLTVPQWCAENSIETKSFYYQLRRVWGTIYPAYRQASDDNTLPVFIINLLIVIL